MDLRYKIYADSDQVAKFQGDWSRELGERVAKKRKKKEKKTSLAFYYRAMHFSAERGLGIACRPSVHPSVRL